MLFRIDPASSQGLADQIAAQVRRALIEGRLSPGDRLPAARELAEGLDVNMHTVLRGYAQLREEGLVEVRRGRGAQIRSGDRAVLRQEAELTSAITELKELAARLGIDRDQLADRIRRA